MNKKTILIIALVLATVLVLVLSLNGNKNTTVESKPFKSQIATEGTLVSTEEPTGADEETEANTETAPTEKPEETEATVAEEEDTIDTFIEENVNMGVAEGDGAGGDIIIDDSNPPVQTQPTKPTESEKENESVILTVPLTEITFEMYNAMSGAEQKAVIDSFGSMEDFVVWFNYVKDQYEAEHPDIEIGSDGKVDLG